MTHSKNRAEIKTELKAKTDTFVSQDKELFVNLSKKEITDKKKERAENFRQENKDILIQYKKLYDFTYDSHSLDFPSVDRTSVYRDVLNYFWIDQYKSRKFVDDKAHVKSIEQKIRNGEFTIRNELEIAKTTSHCQIFALCVSPYTSKDILDMIFDEVITYEGNILGQLLRALALHPNTDPKKIETNIRQIIFMGFNSGWVPSENRDIFFSRPDLTGETIRKIIQYSGIFPPRDITTWGQLCILIHNKNIPEDLKKELLSDKKIANGLKNEHIIPEKSYLNWDKERFEFIDKHFS